MKFIALFSLIASVAISSAAPSSQAQTSAAQTSAAPAQTPAAPTQTPAAQAQTPVAQAQTPVAQGKTGGVIGDWHEASGSVIRIAPCNDALCATIVVVSSAAPVRVDGNNPDPSLRTRPLCGLQIGQGFRGSDSSRAEGGKLYDPRNGKTYKGNMTSDGNTLLLRGYIGVSMFGRTARWDRVTTPVQSCAVDTASTAPGTRP